MHRGSYWLEDKALKPPLEVSVGADTEKKFTVETVENHVYFYATVDSDRCLALVKAIRELDKTLRSEHLSRSLPPDYPLPPIWLHVYSGGGSLFAGLGVADQLKTITSPIFSIVDGYCASAATLISMACRRRYITPSSFFLIHQTTSAFWGTYEEFKDEERLLDMAMKRLTGFYVAHSKLKADEVRELLKRDSWFNAEECLAYGFVDEIYYGWQAGGEQYKNESKL